MSTRPARPRLLQAKLIFNPSAGATKSPAIEIEDVIREMLASRLVPEVCLVEPGVDLPGVVADALARGIGMFVVCGGDGTISTVARSLARTSATLGIVPIGTRNNTALSLGIPSDPRAAIAILRTGRRTKVDVGMVTCGKTVTPFLEICSVGLMSTLFPSFDDFQHGNLARGGDFLAAFAATPPAEIHLRLGDNREIHNKGYVVLIANMPYMGAHYRVGSASSFQDGLLNVLFFSDLSKVNLLSWVFNGVGDGKPEDSRIRRFKVRSVEIDTHPSMPVMADGIDLGEGRLRIDVQRHALNVIVGSPGQAARAARAGSSNLPKARGVRAKALETKARSAKWMSQHRPIARLVGISVGLLLLLLFLPASVRQVLWQGLQSHVLLSVLLVLFSLLGISLVWTTGQRLDAWSFLILNVRGQRPMWLDHTMLSLTRLGGGFGALGLALALYLTSGSLLSFKIGLGTVTLWLVVELTKLLVHRARPFVRLAEARVVGYRAFGRSFPSGHTSQAFFMATLFVQHFHTNVWISCLLYAVALLVGITRIYIGAHYPRDVLAGAILGSGWGLLGVVLDGFVRHGLP